MGAEFWECYTPYNDELDEALKAAQEITLKDGNYYSAGSKEDEIKANQQALENTRNDTVLDEELKEHLISVYSGQVQWLQSLPEPSNTQERISELIIINQETGTRSILDISGISSIPEIGKATPLSDEQLSDMFGTIKPTRDMVAAKSGELVEFCDRLMAICVVIYDKETASEIYFAGYSAD